MRPEVGEFAPPVITRAGDEAVGRDVVVTPSVAGVSPSA